MPKESEVVRVAREYREQLARNESEALRRIARLWVKMERGLQSGYEDLAREVLARMARGEMVPRQFIYTMQRYQSMMDQIRKEMPYYQGTIEDLVTEYQKENYTLGLDASQAIIKASRPSDDTWTRVYKDAAETMAGFAGNGAPLHSLLHRDYNQTAENVLDALIEGVGLGKGHREVAKDMQDAMGGDFDRAMRIARTEMNRSYRLANADQYRASGVVTKVIRLCYKPTACFACLMLDGEECKDFICDDHPNGKCTTVVQTTGGIMPEWETGREWLEEQTEEDQRRIMGTGRFELWKKHGVDPKSMVYIKDNPIWGGSPSVRTLEEMGFGYRGSGLSAFLNMLTTRSSGVQLDTLFEKRGRDENPTISNLLSTINRNFYHLEKAGDYKNNCQRCVPTYEAARRGYKVKAKPNPGHGTDFLEKNPFSVYEGFDPAKNWDGKLASEFMRSGLSGNGKSDIERWMKIWGPGSRGEVFVHKIGADYGHVFIAENHNGNIRYYDPQTGSIDASSNFEDVYRGQTILLRIDKLNFTEYISECMEPL